MGEMIEQRKAVREAVGQADTMIEHIAIKHGETFESLLTPYEYPSAGDSNPDAITVSAIKLAALLNSAHYST